MCKFGFAKSRIQTYITRFFMPEKATTATQARQPQAPTLEPQPEQVAGGMGAGQFGAVLALQRSAGNRAVQHLVAMGSGGPVVQRAPKLGYSDIGTGATAAGQNAGEKKIGTIRRIPISGLSLGNQDDSTKNRYGSAVATKESAAGSVLVLIPDTLDPKKDIEILLHLHGFNEGYRESAGAVRDVSVDRIEQQMQASNRPQLIGILPQGTTKSQFGPQGGFDSDAYIDEVIGALIALKIWSAKPNKGKVILSAHSGGGGAIGEKMLAGKDQTSAPKALGELVLFDAINGPNETTGVVTWVQQQLDHDLAELTKAGATSATQTQYLATSVRFRGYHTGPAKATPNPSINAGYANRYAVVEAAIAKWFKDHAQALGGENSLLYTQLRANYQITAIGHDDHEQVLSKGDKLQEAIGALPPTPTTAPTSTTPLTPANKQQIAPQRSSSAPAARASAAPPSVHAALEGQGQPLDAATRAMMEPRLSHDLSEVRVHTDGKAEDSAEQVQARAYTVGKDIVFGAGQYDPQSDQGWQLLAHELSHVIQQSAATQYRRDAPLPITASYDPSEQEATRNALELSRTKTWHPVAQSAVQRQPQTNPPPLTTRHPENAPTYEQWLETFANLPTFVARDTTPTGTHPTGFTVIGDRAASHDPSAPAGSQPPPPTSSMVSDRFIDRPTDDWVRANLPDNLRHDAYRLPADCADIAVILRHVWLSAHHRTETYRGWVVGDLAGGPAADRALGLIRDVYSGNVAGMVAPYSGANGQPIRTFAGVQNLLHPGDILVWEHHSGGLGTARTGGHTQTIVTVTRNNAGEVTALTLVQGNQPIFQPQAQEIRAEVGKGAPSESVLRDAPGRRIERDSLSRASNDFRDLQPPAKNPQSPRPPAAWTWADGHTTLVAAGPARAAERPPTQNIGGQNIGRLSDWLTTLRAATAANLEGRLEAALQEMRALIDGAQPVTDDEARNIAKAAGERLWQLSQQTSDPQNRSFSPLAQMQRIEQIRASIRGLGRGDSAATSAARNATQATVRRIFTLVEETFHLAARGATSVDYTRRVPAGTRIIKILLTGFDPFNTQNSTQPVRSGDWNPSGAAVMALDGQTIQVRSGVVAAVEGVVLPVNFGEFRGGLVERIVRPLAANVDAVITVSLDPGIAPGAPVRLEQFAVGVHRLNNNVLEAVPAAGTGSAGAAIIQSNAPINDIARDVERPAARGQTAIPRPTIGTDVTLRFNSTTLANRALAALGQPPASDREVTISDPAAIRRIIASMSRATNGTDINFQLGGQSFAATVLSGPGGNFLSNEVSYRVLRALRDTGSSAQSFHVHTQRGTATSGGVIPEDTSTPAARQDRQRALNVAAEVRTNLITTLQRTIKAAAERI